VASSWFFYLSVTNSYDISAVIKKILFFKDIQKLRHCFLNYKFSSLLHVPNFMIKHLGEQKFASSCTDII